MSLIFPFFLGSRHSVTMETQQKLTQVNVALQLKNYEFGCEKYNVSTSARTNRKPLSAVTLPKSGLARMHKKDNRSTPARFDDETSMWREGHEGTVNQSQSESIVSTMFSLTSASERLLSAPLTEMPRLLQRKKQSYLCQGLKQHDTTEINRKDESHNYSVHAESDSGVVAENELPQSGSSVTINQTLRVDSQCESMNADAAENTGSELNDSVNLNSHKLQPITADIQHTGENGDISKEISEEILGHPSVDSYTEAIGKHIEDKDKKTISVHPSSAPQRLLQRYRKNSLVDRPQTSVTKERNTPNSMHRLWSGRSSNAAASSYSCSHLSHCFIPGRHDITMGNTQSISGPHSDLSSLLGDPPCPRQTLHRLHHKAAWYHVPGRYATPKHPFPSRRMQRTKTSKDIESYTAVKYPDHKSKLQEPKEAQEDVTNDLDKENLIFSGTYLLRSGNKTFSNSENLSVHPKFIFKQNSDRSMMVSGLEMLKGGQPEHKSASKSQAVKFKNNVKA